MATCVGGPQRAARVCGSNKCPIHQGKEVAFYCKNCGNFVCADCVIQECQGHVFEGFNKVIPASKQKLQEIITKAELTEIPSIKRQLQAADNDLMKNKTHFENQIRKIRNQNEAIQKELDKITDTFMKIYQGMKQQNSDELLNYKRDLQKRIDKLDSQIQDARRTLQSGNDILSFDMSHVIRSEFDELPALPVCTIPEFTQGKFSVQEVEQLLGNFNISVQNLPENWKVKSEFTPYTGHYVTSIRPTTTAEDQAWLSFVNTTTYNDAEKLLLTDKSGQVKQTLDMDVCVTDFCLSPWFCSIQDNHIREVKGGQSVIRFTTDTEPWSICVTKDGHVVIGHNRCIVKYTQGGNKICRTSEVDGNRPAVRFPWRLSECPLTSNIAVVDLDWKSGGGNDKPFVSILDDHLQLLYIYTGEGQGLLPPTKPFNPRDICFTDTGEILLTELGNNSVVLVSGTGIYLATLYTQSTSEPSAICVQSGAIWISLFNGPVQVLKK